MVLPAYLEAGDPVGSQQGTPIVLTWCNSDFSAAVINTMPKATSRGKSLFGFVVPEGQSP